MWKGRRPQRFISLSRSRRRQGGAYPFPQTQLAIYPPQLQFKVVTPDGIYRTVNGAQNQDLFFALRGGMYTPVPPQLFTDPSYLTGGGGTFGVVLEATILASPRVTLQAVLVSFTPNTTLNQQLWSILVQNGISWADQGWGGFGASGTAILINPNPNATTSSLAPLIKFGQQLQAQGVPGAATIVTTFPSWNSFFTAFVSQNVAVRTTLLLPPPSYPSSSKTLEPFNRSAVPTSP